jgi:predicted ATP-grasp superfamily ATP-dependent carboligase
LDGRQLQGLSVGMEKKVLFKALLLAGIDGVGISRLPRLLSDAGCDVTLFSPHGLLVGRSRYVSRRVGSGPAPARLAAEFRDWMCRPENFYDLIIVGDEVMLHALCRWRGESWLSKAMPVPDRQLELGLISSKHKFTKAAAAAGMTVPESSSVETWEQAQDAADKFGFPMMLKKSSGFSGSGVRMASSIAELRQAYEQLGGGDLMAEEFISGRLGLTETLFHRGKPVAWMSSYNIQSWPTPLSASCIRQTTDHPAIPEVLAKIGAITEFSGFVGIDWICRSGNDSLVIIDFNPRPTPGYHLGPRVGVNFALALRSILSGGQPVEQRPLAGPPDLIWMFPQALHWALEALNARGILHTLGDAPLDDPVLMTAALRRVVTHYFPAALRRHGRPTAGEGTRAALGQQH